MKWLLLLTFLWTVQVPAQTCEQAYQARAKIESQVLQDLAALALQYQSQKIRSGSEYEGLLESLNRQGDLVKKHIYNWNKKLTTALNGSKTSRPGLVKDQVPEEAKRVQRLDLGFKEVSRIHGPGQLLGSLRDGRFLSTEFNQGLTLWTKDGTSYTPKLLHGSRPGAYKAVQLQDGRVAILSSKHDIQIWTIHPDGTSSVEFLIGHSNYVISVIELRDHRLVSVSSDHTIRIWQRDLNQKYRSLVLQGHSDEVHLVTEISDGKFVTASRDGSFRMWTENSDGSYQQTALEGHHALVVRALALNPTTFVSASRDGSLRLWKIEADGLLSSTVYPAHSTWIQSFERLSDGRLLSAAQDNTYRLWTLEANGTLSSQSLAGSPSWPFRVFTTDNGHAISFGSAGEVVDWIPDGRGLLSPKVIKNILNGESLVQLENGQMAIVGRNSNFIHLLEPEMIQEP